MDNNRNHLREPIRARARLLVADQWHDCLITNISSVGARLYFRLSVTVGTAVQIEIAELGPYDATVVWCDGNETGLRFHHDPKEIASVLGVLNA